jgi:acetyl-CoA carboxylase biotin carboxylase subunit
VRESSTGVTRTHAAWPSLLRLSQLGSIPAVPNPTAARKPFRRVLVANRGEIAVRVMRGLVELGIEPVAVHSEADADALHVKFAAAAVCIGPASSRESYLDVAKVVDAALRTGCQAIHPGYGFLSENPALPRAAERAGLVFVGPGAEAMQLLGSKQMAKHEAVAAGVPVVPGFDDDNGDDARLLHEADRVGYPLLIKASAGGGGKGMRLVERSADFADALAAARREAAAAFGDATVLLERRVFPARHVEIQVVADAHGDAVSLGERECSVQRRHQKVLEEAPSPIVDAALRRRMGDAAVALVKRVGYCNAGTVEFLIDEAGQFFFLEVNTRLQVEHPVTELVTGLDLVHLQLAIAQGASLHELLGPAESRRDVSPRGHSIEARICAESPEQGYLPAAGRITRLVEPRGPGVRIDSGVYEGYEVPVHYDSLLAKLIVHAPDRATACRRMSQALADTVILGLPTNVDFLRRVVDSEGFRTGALRIDYLDRHPELAAGPTDGPGDAALIAAVLGHALSGASGNGGGGGGGVATNVSTPWQTIGALRVGEERR